MATIKKRSSTAKAVSQSAIEQVGVLLNELPEKPKAHWSLREAVSLLQDSIIIALNRGYTYEEVAAMLGERGVKIAVPSLKRYLAAVKQEKALASKSRRGGKRSKANAAPTDSPNLSTVSAAETQSASQPASKSPGTKASAKATSESKAEPKIAAKKTSAKPTTRAKATSRTTTIRSRQK